MVKMHSSNSKKTMSKHFKNKENKHHKQTKNKKAVRYGGLHSEVEESFPRRIAAPGDFI